MRRLGPGSGLPAWVLALEEACFGESWGFLGDGEVLWLIGDQAFALWRLVPAAGEAELLRIAVSPEARRQGLAARLMAACAEQLRAEGCPRLHLEVRVSNVAARALYEAAGWKACGLRRRYYRDGEDAALYTWEAQDAR